MPLVLLLSLHGLHIDPLLTAVATILTGMPIGSTTAILAAKYGANAEFASACVFTSTVTSLVTVPFLALFRFFVKFWGAKVSMHSWRGHALNTVRVLFRCVC